MLDTTTRQGTALPTSLRPLDFVPAAITLTPRGHASVAASRFLGALRALPPDDRAEALALFAGDLHAVIADLAREVNRG